MLDSYALDAMGTNYTRTVAANISGDVVIEFRSTGADKLFWMIFLGLQQEV